MAELIGTVTTIRVAVSRKMGDGDYGSYGVDAAVEVALPVGANVADAFDAWDAWLTASVGASMKEKAGLIEKHKPAAEPAPVAQVVQQAPVAEIRTPVTDEGMEYRDITVEFIKVVFSEEGEKRAKTYGKPWMQFGVTTYPEALATVGFDLEAADVGQYALPKPYTKARVLISGKNAKGYDVPKKVDHFIK